MRTISVIVEPDADGTIRLPLPEAWRSRRVRVLAIVESVVDDDEDVEVQYDAKGREIVAASKRNFVESFWQKSFADLTERDETVPENVVEVRKDRKDPVIDLLRRAKIEP